MRIGELTASSSARYCHCNEEAQARSQKLTKNSPDEDERTVEEIMDEEDPVSSGSVFFVNGCWLLAIFLALLVAIAALVTSFRS